MLLKILILSGQTYLLGTRVRGKIFTWKDLFNFEAGDRGEESLGFYKGEVGKDLVHDLKVYLNY